MTGRLVLLSTSPRVAPGALSWAAWSVLREGTVVATDADHPLLAYLGDAGVEVEVAAPVTGVLAPALLDRAARADPLVVLLPQAGEDALARALTALLVEGGVSPVPRSRCCPDPTTCPVRGCSTSSPPWTGCAHRAAAPGTPSRPTRRWRRTSSRRPTRRSRPSRPATADHLREELGDLLLQVMFHSRIATEHPQNALVHRRRRRRHRRQAGAPPPACLRWCRRRRAQATCKRAGRRSRRRRRVARRRSTGCRWTCRPSRWPASSCTAPARTGSTSHRSMTMGSARG